jgi:hypothetical protein
MAMTPEQLQTILDALPRAAPQRRVSIFSSGDSQEWVTWRSNFTLCAEINGWGNARRVAEIASSLEGEAARAVADIATAGLLPPALLDLYAARFVPQAAAQLARSQFKVETQTTR